MQERLRVRYDLFRISFWDWRRHRVWESIARRLPDRLTYFVFIRAWALGMPGDKGPNETTFIEVARYWERKAKL